MLSYLFIFGVFPIIVFYIGMKYYQTVDVLTHGYASAAEMYLNGTYDQKSFQGQGSYEARNNIEGDWVSNDDAGYVMTMKSENMVYEKRDGDISGSGSWIIQDLLRGTQFADLPAGLYLQKNILTRDGKEEILYYKIVTLTLTTLELLHLERGNTLKFTKRNPSRVPHRSL